MGRRPQCHESQARQLATRHAGCSVVAARRRHRRRGDWAHRCHICTGTGPIARTVCTGTGPTSATSALGLGPSPSPHLHRDWAHPCHICTGTARRCVAIAARDRHTRCRVRLRRSECSGACTACRDAAARIRSHGRTRQASDRPTCRRLPVAVPTRLHEYSRRIQGCSGATLWYSRVPTRSSGA